METEEIELHRHPRPPSTLSSDVPEGESFTRLSPSAHTAVQTDSCISGLELGRWGGTSIGALLERNCLHNSNYSLSD
jgi:hypothetical protein